MALKEPVGWSLREDERILYVACVRWMASGSMNLPKVEYG